MSAAFLVPDRFLLNRLISELESRLRESGVVGSMKIVGGAALAKLYPDDEDVRPTTDLQDGEESYLLFAQDVLGT
jgi:hypothetical protein